jgi:hypothetical protein
MLIGARRVIPDTVIAADSVGVFKGVFSQTREWIEGKLHFNSLIVSELQYKYPSVKLSFKMDTGYPGQSMDKTQNRFQRH